MPHTLGKINRVTYGLLTPEYIAAHPQQTHTRLHSAVPYSGKDAPTAASEFAHPDILAGLTVLAYRHQVCSIGNIPFNLRNQNLNLECFIHLCLSRRLLSTSCFLPITHKFYSLSCFVSFTLPRVCVAPTCAACSRR